VDEQNLAAFSPNAKAVSSENLSPSTHPMMVRLPLRCKLAYLLRRCEPVPVQENRNNFGTEVLCPVVGSISASPYIFWTTYLCFRKHVLSAYPVTQNVDVCGAAGQKNYQYV